MCRYYVTHLPGQRLLLSQSHHNRTGHDVEGQKDKLPKDRSQTALQGSIPCLLPHHSVFPFVSHSIPPYCPLEWVAMSEIENGQRCYTATFQQYSGPLMIQSDYRTLRMEGGQIWMRRDRVHLPIRHMSTVLNGHNNITLISHTRLTIFT